MDAIPTSSISTLRTTSFLPSHPPPPKDPLLLKHNHSLYPSLSHKSTKSPPPPPPSSSFQTLKPPFSLTQKPPFPSTTKQHHKASTGYAAALLDVSRCQNSIHAVYKDVHRLMHVLGRDNQSSMKGVVESGGLAKQLVVLVKMLVKKGKAGLVWEVLNEFMRLYDELTCTPVVLVSPERRMGGCRGPVVLFK
ncbi:hypothetical protein J5N97_029382 [Dioscorea zingiberensis]|uniref:Uncharacterized protein n=1 Tax=Dioscorea zingiberensis TaxID=325984 RepID=A0A9D5H5U4_9LILI|nr:hypothetical protein J5N97_029382 [Dioscorea zingiberensis]